MSLKSNSSNNLDERSSNGNASTALSSGATSPTSGPSNIPSSFNEQEAFVTSEPSAGVFFNTEYKRHEDLKEMLDSNRDNLKLEAMKRVIAMIAKGKDMSMLFPAVVKNVVSKNVELKKLVYSYLERYAEEKDDVALLSIATFQRALKEPNPLIRAGALRVLSSIRIPMLTPIVMIAIRDASVDMSAYVRKTAAHAIPKLYRMDKTDETKSELIVLIEKLLDDKTVVVLSSAVMAFTVVCPEKQEFIHKIYRKLCNLISDVDEWGQVIIVNLLTRYARTQFIDPCKYDDTYKSYYDTDSSEGHQKQLPDIPLDADHRLLLRATRPLLQSRNAAVVMAVAQMYYHIGQPNEINPAVKALIRLLKSNQEVQELVLHTIATMSISKKEAFVPYLKNFYVRTSDSVKVKYLKLVVLSNIATNDNISVILRELETYVSGHDDDLIAATIQALGRCACFLPMVTHTCLNGLVRLLANPNGNDVMVAESVLVIKRLLQSQEADYQKIIKQMTRLMDNIEVPQARASIIWLLGEHCRHYELSNRVLRKMAKTFPMEVHSVKLQIMNLAVKLHMTNKPKNDLLCQYIFNLAKYDPNYDIRDRARLLRAFVDNPEKKLIASAAKIFLSTKPAPSYVADEEQEELQLGSMSHALNLKAKGYEPLPDWPEVAPPTNVREMDLPIVEKAPVRKPPVPYHSQMIKSKPKPKPKKRDNPDSWESETSSEITSEDQGGPSESEQSSETTEEESDDTSSSSSESASEESDEDEEEEDEETKMEESVPESEDKSARSNLDLLLDLEESNSLGSLGAMLTPSLGGFLSPNTTSTPRTEEFQVVMPHDLPFVSIEILNRISGKGLTISYRYTRNPHLYSLSMVNINLIFTNHIEDNICDIRLGQKILSAGMSVHEFAPVAALVPRCSLPGTLGIDFNDSLSAANLEIVCSLGNFNMIIKPKVGELMRPITMNEDIFLREQTKLRGMHEHSTTVNLNKDVNVQTKVFTTANLGLCLIDDEDAYRFAGQTLSSSSIVLVTLTKKENSLVLVVNCEKLVIGSMLLNDLKDALS